MCVVLASPPPALLFFTGMNCSFSSNPFSGQGPGDTKEKGVYTSVSHEECEQASCVYSM